MLKRDGGSSTGAKPSLSARIVASAMSSIGLSTRPGRAQAGEHGRQVAADRLQRREREQLGHEGDVDPVRAVGGHAVAEAGQRPPGDRAGDTVGEQVVRALEGQQRRLGGGAERAVDPTRREAGLAQPLLQQLDIGPVGAAAKNR